MRHQCPSLRSRHPHPVRYPFPNLRRSHFRPARRFRFPHLPVRHPNLSRHQIQTHRIPTRRPRPIPTIRRPDPYHRRLPSRRSPFLLRPCPIPPRFPDLPVRHPNLSRHQIQTHRIPTRRPRPIPTIRRPDPYHRLLPSRRFPFLLRPCPIPARLRFRPFLRRPAQIPAPVLRDHAPAHLLLLRRPRRRAHFPPPESSAAFCWGLQRIRGTCRPALPAL